MTAKEDSQPGRIIFSNDLGKLENLLKSHKRPVRFLILNNSGIYTEIHNYLTGLEGSKEVDFEAETRMLRPGFQTKYIELISELNLANHSLTWWTFYFTRKECAYTNFGEKIFNTLLVANFIQRNPTCDNVIVTHDQLLAKQIGTWASKQGFNHIIAQSTSLSVRERIRSFTIGRMILFVLKALHYWIMLRVVARNSVAKDTSYVVVGSLVDERCFSVDTTYKDIYLGELPEFLSQNDTPVLVYGGLVSNAWKTLRSIRKARPEFPVLPWHYFGTINGILVAAWLTVRLYVNPIRLSGKQEIDGVGLERIIKEEIGINIRSGHVFGNFWLHHSAKALADHVNISAFIMPYENRSWEKMLLKGISQENPSINTIGYHHAAVSPAHTNMLLGKNEAQVFPLTNKIVMTGEITREILETSGNYPKHTVTAGCALRRGREAGRVQPRKESGKITNVLVALASSGDEYISTLQFLDQALSDESSYQIGIRPHPEFSLDQALAHLPRLRLKFQRMGDSLESNFDWADVVLYVSSTVGLDSISVGLPVVGIDLGKFTNYDPAPEDCPLKWAVSNPEQLVPVLLQIENIGDSEYESLQSQAVEFGKRYFYPVTDERLNQIGSLLSANYSS